jgi:hypothetical protein
MVRTWELKMRIPVSLLRLIFYQKQRFQKTNEPYLYIKDQ